MTRPVARVSSPGEVAALVPDLIGFHPAASLVALALDGRKRVGLTLRVDLVDPAHQAALVAQVARALVRGRARRALLLVFTDEPDGARELPQADLVQAVTARLETAGIPVEEAVLVREGLSLIHI